MTQSMFNQHDINCRALLIDKLVMNPELSYVRITTSYIKYRADILAICAGNSQVSGEFLTQRPVTRSFDVFFDLRMNKPLSKPWWGWWF